MPIADMRVEDYVNREGVYKWLVIDKSGDGLNEFAKSSPFSEVRFYSRELYDSSMVNFHCSCYRLAPGADPFICDHILFVARYITQKTGSWEQDTVLMDRAWLIATGEKKESDREKWASGGYATQGKPTTLDAGFLGKLISDQDMSKELSKTIYEQFRKTLEEPRYNRYIPLGVDPAAQATDVTAARDALMKERDELKEEITKKQIMKNAEADQREWEEQMRGDTSSTAQESEHKEPEEPRKPKSRFSEIDL